MQGCKQGHMNLKIQGCKDARIQASTDKHKDMRMRGCEDINQSNIQNLWVTFRLHTSLYT